MSNNPRPSASHNSTSDDNVNKNQIAIAGSANQLCQDLPKMFNLTVDCFEEIFDYLSLIDIYSVAQTCKTMRTVAGDYFKQYISINGSVDEEFGEIFAYRGHTRFGLLHLSPFIKNVCVSAKEQPYGINFQKCPNKHDFDKLQPIESRINESAINHIELYAFHLNWVNIERIRNILGKVESITLRWCLYSGDFYDGFLKHCKNLKRLDVNQSDLGPVHKRAYKVEHGRILRYPEEDENVRNGCLWMRQNYPKLEYFNLFPFERNIVNELSDFLDRHPNIRTFGTSTGLIHNNQEQFLRCNAKFDVFCVELGGSFVVGHFEETCSVIKRLHSQGFYKRLHFDIGGDCDTYEQLASLPGLEKLNDNYYKGSVSKFFNLTNLKELCVDSKATQEEMETLASRLQRLEKVHLKRTTYDYILPFIYRSPNLKKLTVSANLDGDFNLIHLNKERAKLVGAHKLIIYVPEYIYLKTKWNAPNGDTNLSLVEMRRCD